MNHSSIVTGLANNIEVYRQLLKNLDAGQIAYRQNISKWNLLEVVCHLLDEEKEDFGARVRHTLLHPELPLPSIDPVGWVISRNYAGRQFDEVVALFLLEREKNITWLQSLKNPNWKSTHQHPKFGSMSAEYFLANWLAHDYLHFRQIVKLKYDYTLYTTGISLNYAGDW
jgi:hypothetical protein